MPKDIRKLLGLGAKKSPMFVQSRSHALNASKKVFKTNLQKRTVTIEGKKYKIKLTASEIRSLDKKGISLSR